jgi:hypothetical protein
MVTKRFDAALRFAADLHKSQFRKGTETPYIGHLLAVTALVIDDGGSEDEAIAALLHDSIEDQGEHYPGRRTALRHYIRDQFGVVVADIVACTCCPCCDSNRGWYLLCTRCLQEDGFEEPEKWTKQGRINNDCQDALSKSESARLVFGQAGLFLFVRSETFQTVATLPR